MSTVEIAEFADVVTKYDPRSFGCKGDGTTDDTVNMQAAINSGEKLAIPTGLTFLISAPLTNPANTPVVLDGRGGFKLANSANCTLFSFDLAVRSCLQRFSVDGNKANQTTATIPLIRLRNSAYSKVLGIYGYNAAGDFILCENHNGSTLADEITLALNEISGSGRDNAVLSYSTDAATGTLACTAGAAVFSVSQAGKLTNNHQIAVAGVNYVVSNFNGTTTCTLSGAPTFAATAAWAFVTQPIGDMLVQGNRLYAAGAHGLHLVGGTADIIAQNNILSNTGHGIFTEGVVGSAFAFRNIYQGNQSRNNGGAGHHIYAGGGTFRGGGLTFDSEHYHYNNALGGASNFDLWDTDRARVVNCHFGDEGFAARAVYAAQLSYATNVELVACDLTTALATINVTNGSTYQSIACVGLANKARAVAALTDAVTIALDASTGNDFTVTLAGNRTVGAPTNPANGQRIEIVVIQDATGGRTLAWNAVFKQAWSDTGNTLGKRSSVVFVYDGVNWNQIGAQSPYI